MIINTAEYNFFIKQSDRLQIHFDYDVINSFYFYNFIKDKRYKFFILAKPKEKSKPKIVIKDKIYLMNINNINNDEYRKTYYVFNQLAEIVGSSFIDKKILKSIQDNNNTSLFLKNIIPTDFETLKILNSINLKIKLTENFLYRNTGFVDYNGKIFNDEFYEYFEVINLW